MSKKSILNNKELIIKIIRESSYYSEALRKLGFSTTSGCYYQLKRKINEYNIDISRFKNRSEQMKGNIISKKYNLEDILVENFDGKLTNYMIKKKLYKKGLKTKECEICGVGENWNGKILPFILDHINGNNKDNRIENLRIICPNCDSTLSTYMGRNKKNKISKKKKQERIIIENKFERDKKNKELAQDKINQLINKNIDFSKRGWRNKSSKILNISPQYVGRLIKKYSPEIWSRCYKNTP